MIRLRNNAMMVVAIIVSLAGCDHSSVKGSSPGVDALVADEVLLNTTIKDVVKAVSQKKKAADGASENAISFADILGLTAEPQVKGAYYCCDSCQSEEGGPVGVGPGGGGGASCTGCSQTGLWASCANFKMSCGSSGCWVFLISGVAKFSVEPEQGP